MNIYLDTNLWNELCDQNVNPEGLLESLAAKQSNLVTSYQVVYELARCFAARSTEGIERGKALFSCLRGFVNASICCVTEITEILPAEMWALRTAEPTKPFLNSEGYKGLSYNVEKLAIGDFDERAQGFVAERAATARQIRSGPTSQLDLRPDVKQRLQGIPEQQLATWLESETMTGRGAAQLAIQITRRFPEYSSEQAEQWASGLLALPSYRLASALVRADLYYSWRCANRGSNPKDLYDDMYHVLNAIYCDVYATKEPGHAKYADLLLTPNTRVAIYTGQPPLDEWIDALR